MKVTNHWRATARAERRRFVKGAVAALGAAAWPGYVVAGERIDKLSIGHAEVDITPPLGIELAGFHKPVGHERVITGIRQATAARALVLRVGDQRVAIVSLEMLGVSADFARGVQQRIAAEVGIPAEHVRICATHTHSMPTFVYLRQWGAIPEKYRAATADNVVRAVRMANADVAPAALHVGKARVAGGNFNRTTGSWKTDAEFTAESTDAERWLDTELHTLRLERSGKPDVLWYHFSCHPVCYGDGEAGPDWVGLVARQVRDKHGVTPAYLQGHAGDVNPGDGKKWIGDAEPTAQAIVKGIDAALGASERVAADEMRLTVDRFGVPLDNALLAKQLERYRQAPEKCTSGEWVDAGFAKAWFESAQHYKLDATTHATPISALRLGELALLFHSSELYSYYGLQIRRDSPLKKTLVVGYTDDIIGYLVDPRAYEAGEYAATTVPRILDLPPFATNSARDFAQFAQELLKRTT